MADPVKDVARVNLVAPDGAKLSVPASEAAAALEAGYRAATADEVAAEKERERFTSTPEVARAGAEGLLRGVSMGLSDPLAAGISSAEDVRRRQEYNPELALGAELVGGVAPLFATGGTGAIATGARAVGALPRAVMRAGTAVERGAAGLVGEGMLGRGASMALGGAVEGAAVGAGQAVSRAALEDVDLTAEMVTAGMGHGALLGGAAGGALGTAAGAAGKLLRAAGDAGKAVANGARGLLPDGALGAAARDAGEEGSENFLQKFARQQRAVRELDDVQQAEIRSIRADGSRKEELFDAISNDLDISNKIKSVQSAIGEDAGAGAIQRTSRDAVESASTLVQSLKSEVDEIAGAVGSYEPREIGAAKALKKFVDETDLQIRKLSTQPGAEVRGEIFAQLDQLKRRVGKTQERLGGRGSAGPDDVVFTAGSIMRGEYDKMAAHLVDPSMYGRAAADIQAPDNVAWTNWFDTRDAYRKMFLTDAGGKRTATGFDQVDVMSPDSVGSLVKGMGRAEGELKEEMFRRSVEATDQLVEQLARSHSVGPETAKLVAENRELGARMIAGIDKAKVTSESARAQRDLLDDLRGFPMAEAAARIGVTLAEKGAMLIGARKQAEAVSGKIDRAIQSAIGTAKSAASRTSSAAKQQAAKATRRERFDVAVKRVEEANANPEGVAERIAEKIGDHRVSAGVVGTVVRGQAFLRGKMPAPLLRDSDRQRDKDDTPRVSTAEMAKWMRYVDAVENPMSVVAALESGELTREGAEALREVHPKLFAEVKRRVDDGIATAGDRVPRTKLVQLSILFDEPYHFSMEPGFMLAMQKLAAGDGSEGGPGKSGASSSEGFLAPSARSAPNTAEQMLTNTQRLSQ